MPNYMKLFLIIILFFCSFAGSAYSFGIEPVEFTLDNGLEVLLFQNSSSATVSGRILYKVGSINEQIGATGLAHMLEHMMFKGTQKIGTKDFEREIFYEHKIDSITGLIKKSNDSALINRLNNEKAQFKTKLSQILIPNHYWSLLQNEGAVGINAFTSKDLTVYFANLPSNKLELWIALESDRMANPVFREFAAEKNVVAEERRQMVDTRPRGRAFELLLSNAYMVHPYRHPILGWTEDINKYTKEQIVNFFEKFYGPNNAVVVIAGDIDIENTKRMVEKYFGHIPSRESPNQHITREPTRSENIDIEMKDRSQPFMFVAYNLPDNDLKTQVAMDVVEIILSEGRSSRLYSQMVRDSKTAISASAFNYFLDDPGLFVFSVVPSRETEFETIISQLDEIVSSINVGNIEDWEIEKARNSILTSFYSQIETNSGITAILGSYQSRGHWSLVNDYLKLLKNITAEEISEIASKVFRDGNRTTVRAGFEKRGEK